MNPKPFESWQCASCGRVFTSRACADMCCICRKCGGHAGDGRLTCQGCVDSAHEDRKRVEYDKARKVRWDEYDGDCVYAEGIGGEYFFDYDPDELIDAWASGNAEPFPGFAAFRVYGTYTESIQLDVDELEDLLRDGAYEDYEVDGRMREDLVRVCDEWNAKHADKVYWPDRTVAIVYDEVGA